MNQKIILLLLTVLKLSINVEIYITDFIVEFNRPEGGKGM